ncbi:MAG: S1 RNA-binding domain-containing protein, partial [Caldilineaceae bacterium]|nr:S1 RNA-binding domain-containing protein [Caldilineaceae bacterium]
DFAAMLEEFVPEAKSARLRVGDLVEGEIVSIGASSVFVSLTGSTEGVLGREQVTDDDGNVTVSVGDRIKARVAEVEGASGCIVLKRSVTRGAGAADELQAAFVAGIPVDGVVTAVNKGGFDVTVAGQRAFCPISQIDTHFVETPETFVGQKFTFQITKFEGGKRPNIVVSRRALLEQQNAEKAEKIRETLVEGAVVSGKVTTIKDYGAFVDIGGLEGMIHISELGHVRVGHPSEVLSVGQEITAKVLKLDAADGSKGERIALSIRGLLASPWENAADSFVVGSKRSGTIVRLQPFGAFVELTPGVEGLVHISELGANRRINHPKEVVGVGDVVEVTVLAVDPINQRISLSMKSPDQIAEPDADRQAIKEVNAAAAKGLGTFADLLKG